MFYLEFFRDSLILFATDFLFQCSFVVQLFFESLTVRVEPKKLKY